MSGRLIQMSGLVVDLVYRVDGLPASGEEVEAKVALVAAGGGFNALAAAKRCGVDVAYGGTLGSGVYAEIARNALDVEGVPILQRRRKAVDQGTCVVLVDRFGERSFVSHHGAERWLELADLETIQPAHDDWILVSGYALFHPRSTAAMTAWLRQLPPGPKLLFDPGPLVARIPRAALAVALERADWLSANQREAEFLTGEPEPARAARALSSSKRNALARVGPEGCWLATSNLEVEPIAGFAIDAIDTTGAGDAHDGAFIAASLLGASPRAAAKFANAAAAISATRNGPATAPGLAEVRAFLTARGADIATLTDVRPPAARSEAGFR